MICIPIIENDVELMVKKANAVDSDLIELRLDYLDFENFRSRDLEKIRNISKPKIATCMPKWEGGNFSGAENERIEILLTAAKYCDYVTIELNTKKRFLDKIIKSAKNKGVKVIVSYHNFDMTPERGEIMEILKRERDAGADIAKIAFMPKDYTDVLNVIYCLADNDLGIPVIVLSIGELGKITRVMALAFGSYLTFASSEKGKESAPGQLTAKEIREILQIL